jgi:SAM-dependent methyltransferase
MIDWGQGYQVEIPYIVGFYPEMAPAHLETALLFAGFKADLTRPGARYCELGCGYGLTTLILAAANPQMSFVGIDFNPTHIVAANALAEAAQLPNVRFIESSFDELFDPRFSDLGQFDIIGLHGVYSWVAPAIRRAIVKFADIKLATGGALYLSYNAAPGWMPRAPLQRLLFESAKRNPGEPRAATAEALRFAKAMKEAGAFYFKANPQLGAFMDSMERMDFSYLVHEHLNESWSALYHADVAADFAKTTMRFACSAHIADNIGESSVPITTRSLLPDPGDGVWYETVKDFLVEASKAAGIDELHFHDLRGTAVTMLATAGCTTPEIAAIIGHSLVHVTSILDKYLSRTPELAEAAIGKLERAANKSANRLHTKKGRAKRRAAK